MNVVPVVLIDRTLVGLPASDEMVSHCTGIDTIVVFEIGAPCGLGPSDDGEICSFGGNTRTGGVMVSARGTVDDSHDAGMTFDTSMRGTEERTKGTVGEGATVPCDEPASDKVPTEGTEGTLGERTVAMFCGEGVECRDGAEDMGSEESALN